jgi:hypothetical protein
VSLKTLFGFTGKVFSWTEYILIGLSKQSKLEAASELNLWCTLTFGSVLSSVHTSPVALIASSSAIFQQQHANYPQLFISLSHGLVTLSIFLTSETVLLLCMLGFV